MAGSNFIGPVFFVTKKEAFMQKARATGNYFFLIFNSE